MELSFTLKKTSLGKHSLIALLILDLENAVRVEVESELFVVRGKIGLIDVIGSYLLKLIFDVTFNKILLFDVIESYLLKLVFEVTFDKILSLCMQPLSPYPQ